MMNFISGMLGLCLLALVVSVPIAIIVGVVVLTARFALGM